MTLGLPGGGPVVAAHQHFARALGWLCVGVLGVAVSVIVWDLVTDRRFDEERLRQRLLLETEARARYVGNHLRLLSEELARLGRRAEVDLLDGDLAPERTLLELAHADSTFFNLGVGLLDANGAVLSAVPRSFLPLDTSFAQSSWFAGMRAQPAAMFVAVDPDHDAVLYVVSPVVRRGEFTGAMVGGIDLARDRPFAAHDGGRTHQTAITTASGSVVFPALPPVFASSAAWKELFSAQSPPPIRELLLEGRPTIVAIAAIGQGGLLLAKLAARDALLRPAAARLRTRLLLVLAALVAPLLGLVYLFRRTLLGFQRTELAAVREERLRRLGEASNLIAHEVRNSLNGLRIGMDLVLDGRCAPTDRVVHELRTEVEHLISFTHQLMLFANDPNPRVSTGDLAGVVQTALKLALDLAAELGIAVEVRGTDHPVHVELDPLLIRIVISNLISNSLDALATMPDGDEAPRLEVCVMDTAYGAAVRVRDNGPGVPPGLEHTLFEPFVTSKPSGVGIGLALARKIARAHGGELRLEPCARGASFLLELKWSTP